MSIHILHYADIEGVHDSPRRLAKLAGLINERSNDGTLVLGAGDNIAPGVLPLMTDGRFAIEFFECIQPDVDTLGNHEFDFGVERATELVEQFPQKYVCANVWTGEERFGADAGLSPWTILTADGVSVGVFGVISEQTKESAPKTESLEFSDPVDAAEEAVSHLESRGPDHIVGVSHCGDDRELAQKLDVPVILGGHLHDRQKRTVDETLLIRPGSGGHYLSEIELDSETATGRFLDVSQASPAHALSSTVRNRVSSLGMDEVITELSGPVEKQAMYGESPIGNFVADAFRAAANADVGIINGGTIRSDGNPLHDAVSEFDIRSITPFDNSVCRVRLDGRELRDALAEASGYHLEWQSTERWHGQISNATVVYDHQNDDLMKARIDGSSIDPTRTYTVATHITDVRPGGQFPSLDVDEYTCVCHIHDALLDFASEYGIPTQTEDRVRRIGAD